LFSELLQGRVEVPLPDPSESLLVHHAHALLQENQQLFASIEGGHRSDSFNSLILPQSETVIEAIGHALAYSYAVKSSLPKPILDVYECAIIRCDPAWYTEQGGISRIQQRIREDEAVSSFMPHLEVYLEELNIDKYVSAPIVSDNEWKSYLGNLPVFSGGAIPQVDHLQASL